MAKRRKKSKKSRVTGDETDAYSMIVYDTDGNVVLDQTIGKKTKRKTKTR